MEIIVNYPLMTLTQSEASGKDPQHVISGEVAVTKAGISAIACHLSGVPVCVCRRARTRDKPGVEVQGSRGSLNMRHKG